MTAAKQRPAGSELLARFDIDSDHLARGLSEVVLAIADLLRELMERQAIRRMDAGDLTDDQIEKLGSNLLRIREEIANLRTAIASNADHQSRRSAS